MNDTDNQKKEGFPANESIACCILGVISFIAIFSRWEPIDTWYKGAIVSFCGIIFGVLVYYIFYCISSSINNYIDGMSSKGLRIFEYIVLGLLIALGMFLGARDFYKGPHCTHCKEKLTSYDAYYHSYDGPYYCENCMLQHIRDDYYDELYSFCEEEYRDDILYNYFEEYGE